MRSSASCSSASCPRWVAWFEGGIGAGGNLAAFAARGYQVTGFDTMPESVTYCRQCGLVDVHVHDLAEPWPVVDASARAVVLLDVLAGPSS